MNLIRKTEDKFALVYIYIACIGVVFLILGLFGLKLFPFESFALSCTGILLILISAILEGIQIIFCHSPKEKTINLYSK